MIEINNKDVPSECYQKDTAAGWEAEKCIPKRCFMGKAALKMGFESFVPDSMSKNMEKRKLNVHEITNNKAKKHENGKVDQVRLWITFDYQGEGGVDLSNRTWN